jgi:hypothetical protein
VVLEDIADRACRLVEHRAALDADRLGDGDLDVVDELAVPQRLEDPVREAKRQQVLDRLLPEVVVDPVDLLLVEVTVDLVVQAARALPVRPERLLDDHARPALPLVAAAADLLDEGADRARWNREVEDPVPGRPALLVELRQQCHQLVLAAVGGEVGADVAHAGREPLPDLLVDLVAPVLPDRVLHPCPELRVRLGSAGDADDGDLVGQQVAHRERVDRREELPLGQVTRRAEDDHGARVGRPRDAEPFGERVPALRVGGLHGVAAELLAQGGVDLRRERLVLARGEPRKQRRRDRGRRDALVDRVEHRPAAFARVVDVAADLLQAGIFLEREHEQVEQPAPNDEPVLPQRGDAVEVERELRGLHDLEALRERLHHPVLDPVVDHLHEVAAPTARRTRSPLLGPGPQERLELPECGFVAAHHHAVALLQPQIPPETPA